MSAQSLQDLTPEAIALRYLKNPFSLPQSQMHLLNPSRQRNRGQSLGDEVTAT